ncbi:MAG: hypothetical protein VX777_10025 [Chlamydiota bacterium]|nr:hypothetical protein [Chlamydiota bacterium]
METAVLSHASIQPHTEELENTQVTHEGRAYCPSMSKKGCMVGAFAGLTLGLVITVIANAYGDETENTHTETLTFYCEAFVTPLTAISGGCLGLFTTADNISHCFKKAKHCMIGHNEQELL